jgi:ribosomal protein L24E
MPIPYGNLAPADLIRQVASPAPQGFGFENPPSLNPILQTLGLENNPFARRISDELQAEMAGGRGKTDPSQKKKVQSSIGEGGSFVHLDRRPFTLTCQRWLDSKDPNTIKYLYCRVNPRSVQWTMNLRVSDQKTLSGTVQHAWRQNRGVRRRTYFSEPTLTITFQSGNIMPVIPAKFKNPEQPQKEIQIPSGLNMFYRFVDLLGDSRIIDAGTGDRSANVVYIMYTSHIYPSIVLAGMFTPEGFSFTDSAEDPNKVEWTANFTIYDSFPRFDNADMLINTWKTTMAPIKNQNGTTASAVAEQDAKAKAGREISQERQERNEP